MKLNQSQVIFNEENHTYTLNGKRLSGVTSILSRYLFPKKYAGVPEQILQAAKEHGTLVHQQIQCYINGFEPSEPTEELQAFRKFIFEDKDFKISDHTSEYLVSDNESVASQIDLVYCPENSSRATLIDIKTTAEVDIEYLSWQLSIYAYLFELNNPNIKAHQLVGIHIRGSKLKLYNIKRIDDDLVKSFLDAFRANLKVFRNPLKQIATTDEKLLQNALKIEKALITYKEKILAYEMEKKLVNERLHEIMEQRGITKWETDNLVLTRRLESKRKSIDTERLKKEQPDVYEKYQKESVVKGSVTIKIKNQ